MSDTTTITNTVFHVKDGWLHFGNRKVPSFTRVRATLSGDAGCFVAMTDEGHPIFAWPDYAKSTCNCQHIEIETYLPGKIPPIEMAATPTEKAAATEEGKVVTLDSRRVKTDEYLGGCPHCGQNNGFLNLGRDHWVLCDRHKTKWCYGSNIFSIWREEDEETWQRNRFKLSEYMTVKPIHPEPTEDERREMEECKTVMRRTGYVEGADSQVSMSDAEFNAELDAVFPLEDNADTPPLSLRVIESDGSDQA